jgi:hypothetical protein
MDVDNNATYNLLLLKYVIRDMYSNTTYDNYLLLAVINYYPWTWDNIANPQDRSTKKV